MKYAEYIDYTNLKANATKEDIKNLCNEAMEYHFASVCVNPCYVELAKELLDGSTVNVGTVIGFPLGANTIRVKEMEALIAVEDGADEIDMVINIGAVKNGDYEYVRNEIEDIMAAVDGKTLKVIIETCYLNEEEIGKLTDICNETYVNFIKTSTGFGKRGADRTAGGGTAAAGRHDCDGEILRAARRGIRNASERIEGACRHSG